MASLQIVLASRSPRRRQLIATLGFPVTYVDIDVDEHIDGAVAAADIAASLACRKAAAYDFRQLTPGQILVTADTVVVLDDKVLGKPHSRDEAVSMLTALSGHSHTVYTGVCIATPQRRHAFIEATRVHFRQLRPADIDYYVDTYRPYDKAGSYGIQEWIGMVGIEGIEGCYYNVMGLPVSRLYHEIMQIV